LVRACGLERKTGAQRPSRSPLRSMAAVSAAGGGEVLKRHGPRYGEPLRCRETHWNSRHVWGFDASRYLSAVGKLRPSVAAAAALGLGLRALATELKDASVVLLGLLSPVPLNPPQQPALAAGVEGSLRSALHLCTKVHAEEILPAAVYFSGKGGGPVQDWVTALRRVQSSGRHGGVPGQVAPKEPTEEDIAKLTSKSQAALLRVLRSASEHGVEEAAPLHSRLAAHFCACERLRRRAIAAARRPSPRPRRVSLSSMSETGSSLDEDDEGGSDDEADKEELKGIGEERAKASGATRGSARTHAQAPRPFAWELAPWRCSASGQAPSSPLSPAVAAARAIAKELPNTSSEDAFPSRAWLLDEPGSPLPEPQQLRCPPQLATQLAGRKPICWRGALQPGYILCEKQADLAVLAAPSSTAAAATAPTSARRAGGSCHTGEVAAVVRRPPSAPSARVARIGAAVATPRPVKPRRIV